MSIYPKIPDALIEAVLNQKPEMVSDFGINLHKGGPVSLDGLIKYKNSASRDHYMKPMLEGRLYRPLQSSQLVTVTQDLSFTVERLAKTMRKATKQMMGYDRNMGYHMRLHSAMVDNDFMAAINPYAKKTRSELLASIGSSKKIHALIWSSDKRKTKRGWRLYLRNQK